MAPGLPAMLIAAVGDVHGHLALMYAVLGRWQREHGRRIDLILQAGDLGAFPAGAALDRATVKYAARDPEELGFAAFAGDAPPPTPMDPRPPLVFIPGNHEDFEYLDACARAAPAGEPIFAVTRDGAISALRSGRVWTFEAAGARVRIGGVSGIVPRGPRRPRHPRVLLDDDDALRLLGASAGGLDVLLSHEAPAGFWDETRGPAGSPALAVVIEEAQPALAFFGHYDEPSDRRLGRTRVVALAGCGYEPHGAWRVKPGGFAIVEWTAGEPRVERLEAPWLSAATRRGWRHWT